MRIIQSIGNKELWDREKTLFLSSKLAPLELYGRIFQWVESLTARDCVVCFNTSELEVEVMKALVESGVPTILVVMNRFREEHNIQIAHALKEGRMLILVLERDEPRGLGAMPRLRNEFIASQVDHIVCGFVSRHGSIRPLVADKPNVTVLEHGATVQEPDSHPYRWSVGEDKTLLRLFYEDHSIHAIKRSLRRPYAAIRLRLHAITMPEEVLKGREFEDFVLEILGVQNDENIKLLEWRGDKSLGSIYPENNRYPDLLLEYTGEGTPRRIAIECKWRQKCYIAELLDTEKAELYQQYAKEKKARMVCIWGFGGQPCAPEEVYLVPIEATHEIIQKPTALKHYRRPQPEAALGSYSPELKPYLSDKEKGKAYSVKEIRTRYARAYFPWAEEEDILLLKLHEEGMSTKELSAKLGRKPSAIRSRIRRLTEEEQ